MTESRVRFYGPHAAFFRDETAEIDIEGALSSGKTTVCLEKVFDSLVSRDGIHWWIGRYGDGETQTKVRPAFEAVCQGAGEIPAWNSKELCYDFANGSKCYAYGLKSPDALSRYSKMRGMGVAGIYLDQTEELPEDFSLELRLRLRQRCGQCAGCLRNPPGACARFPHQLIFSPNPPNVTHWLAQQFPSSNTIPGRKYYAVSIYDNQHNLPPSVIEAAIRAYPPDHAKHRSVILGLRGMNVTGEPVFRGAFVRGLHEVALTYDPRLPLEQGIDFGKHHPCVVWRQVSPLGQVRYLGGILGQSLYLDDFLDLVLRYRSQWFPSPVAVKECCDPAGASNPIGVDMGSIMRAKGMRPVYQQDSNSPAMRIAAVERQASQMRKRASDRQEMFAVNADAERWLTVSESGVALDKFLADGFEAGYVWDEHEVSVGNKKMRKPKADGWYEHGQVCTQYLELNFGSSGAKKREAPPRARSLVPAGRDSWMG